MKIYQTKAEKLSGTEFREVHKKAFRIYQEIKRRSKRRAYIRSCYFNKEKVFLAIFWQHLFEKKNWKDRVRRIKYFCAALELIQNSKFEPKSKENPNQANEILHRFTGITKEGDLFHVQVKEDKKSGQKYLISMFPEA
mgnify:CR=1 FL=1